MSDVAPTLIGAAAPVVASSSSSNNNNKADDLLYPRSKETLQNHVSRDIKFAFRSKWTDLTLLNIRENMNDGKSQTWFHYAALVSEELGIDYVGKMDTDSLPYMDRFFDWINVQNRLLPSPYNKNILVGNPVNKDWWWQSWTGYTLTKEQKEKEKFFTDTYDNHFHIYAQGQCYILSTDLAYFVAQEAQLVLEEGQYEHLYANSSQQQQEEEDEEGQKAKKTSNTQNPGNLRRETKAEQAEENAAQTSTSTTPGITQQQPRYYGDYIEGHEDHDVAAMAFHSPYPIQFQFLTKYQLFWRHGVKNRKGINAAGIWGDEVNRIREWVPYHTNHASTNQPKNDRSVETNSMAYIQR